MTRKKGKKRNTSEAAPTPDFATNFREIDDARDEDRAPRFIGDWDSRVHAVALFINTRTVTTEEAKKLLFALIEDIAQEADNYRKACDRLQEKPSLEKAIKNTAESMEAFSKAMGKVEL